MVDVGGEMQTMDEVLMQKDGCAAAVVASHIAAGIVEKWWRQHLMTSMVLLKHQVASSGVKVLV